MMIRVRSLIPRTGAAAILVACAFLALGAAAGLARQEAAGRLAAMQKPRYTEAGKMLRPEGYEEWMFVGASIGLSYSENAPPREGPGVFHHTYMQREAYAHYKATGKFPEGSIFVLELFEPRRKESINRDGFFMGDRRAVEVAVKDANQFEEGWAYFDFPVRDGEVAGEGNVFPKTRCFDCHVEHADDDNVFTQFYPVLRSLKKGAAEKKDTAPVNPPRPYHHRP